MLSNFLLFILNKRNTLSFITSLILEVEFLWQKENNRKRIGIANLELEVIYVLLPLLKYQNKNNVKNIAAIIINLRKEYELFKLKTNTIKSYKDFLSNYVEDIKKTNHCIEFIEFKKRTNNNFELIKISTARDYIDVLFRTLVETNCFNYKFQHVMKSIIINNDFNSKLSYFITKNIEYIEKKLLNQKLEEDLRNYEIDFFKNSGLTIKSPVAYRYDKKEQSRKISYLDYENKEDQHKETTMIIDSFYKEPNWYTFEHLNNLIACYYLKFNENEYLTEENIKYAIKIDSDGNIKNSTTGGIEDFSHTGDKSILIVESTLLKGLESFKLEFASVKKHAERYYNTKKPILCLIIFKDEPDMGLQDSFISTNKSNIDCGIECFFLALSFENYKKLFFGNIHKSILDIIQEIKVKLINFDFKKHNEQTYSHVTFKSLQLEFLK